MKVLCKTGFITRSIDIDKNGQIFFLLDKQLRKLNDNSSEVLYEAKEGKFTSMVYHEATDAIYICTNHFVILQYSLNSTTNPVSVFVGKERPDVNFEQLSHIDDSLHPLQTFDGPFEKVLFWDLRGITLDTNGDLLVVDRRHIRRIDMKQHQVETICQSSETYYFIKHPFNGLFYSSRPFINAGCTVYSVDPTSKKEIKLTNSDSEESKINNPRGLLLDADGTLLVANDDGVCKLN